MRSVPHRLPGSLPSEQTEGTSRALAARTFRPAGGGATRGHSRRRRSAEQAAEAGQETLLAAVDDPLPALDQALHLGMAPLEPVESTRGPDRVAGQDQQPDDEKDGTMQDRHDQADHTQREQAVAKADGSESEHHPLAIASHSASLKICTPYSRALFSFEPASVP